MDNANSTYNVGPAARTPREVRELRRRTLEFHHRLGVPVIFKRRKTLEDVEAGNEVRCPYHFNIQYQSDLSGCPYCFGTGILGGYDSGLIVYVSPGDAPEDLFQLTENGLLTRMTHPQWTAPWTPEMHDGDLIIYADFDPDTLEVITTSDRFELDQVTPVAPRGAAPLGYASHRDRNTYTYTPTKDLLVAQNFRADLLPKGSFYYNVPIVEPDLSSYPPLPAAPPGTDVDDFNPVLPATGEVSMVMRVRGGDPPAGY